MIYLVLGRRERGKTTLAYWMARKTAHRVVLDARRLISRTDDDARSVHVHSADAFAESVGAVLDDEMAEVIYWPSQDDLMLAFDDFAHTLKTETASRRVPLAIMVDEASFFNLDAPAFQWLAKCSFRDVVHIIITAHRPQDVPTTIRSIADHWLVFQTTQEHDLKVLAQRSPQVAALAPKLTGRDFIHWDDSRAALSENRNARSWYVQLSSVRSDDIMTLTDWPKTDPKFSLE